MGPRAVPPPRPLIRVEDAPSPNCGERRGGAVPSLVVLHYTGMETAEAALARLRDPASAVSAHYLIGGCGRIWRLAPEEARAWHAGAGRWGEVEDVNSRSIGIELANPGPLAGFPPFPEPQMAALEALLASVLARWRIAPEGVVAHSDVAPTRKGDPGRKFDWRRLAHGGLSVWPERLNPGAPDPARFAAAARGIGYGEDAGAEAVLAAFRLRFRPGAGGPLAAADVAVAEAVAARWPCATAAAAPGRGALPAPA
jgi:N-acetylmuramoyl-L-alanine amidase